MEFYFKNDDLGDPLVSEEHILAFGWATQQDLDDMVSLALRVNDFLSGLFLGVGIRLVDFKIEIGRIWDGDYMRLIVADEISPDSCRLWDMETGKKLDKDVFRRDLGDLADAYTEVARRLGVMPQGPTGGDQAPRSSTRSEVGFAYFRKDEGWGRPGDEHESNRDRDAETGRAGPAGGGREIGAGRAGLRRGSRMCGRAR